MEFPALRNRIPFFFLAMLLLFGLAGQALAAVEIAFYSRELGGNNFPHAFVSLKGTVDATGEAVDTSYGFTAKAVTPAILLGSVAGEVVVEGERQIARSDRQFAFTLTDEQKEEYDKLRRRVLWKMPYGLYVVGSRAGERRNGMTLNWATQVSFEPKLHG